MNLSTADHFARCITNAMHPFCDRVEVAGSIRRGKSEVGDIEIVAIPKWENAAESADLFGESPVRRNLLYEWAQTQTVIQWIKTGTPKNAPVVPWKVNPDGKYWRGYLPLEKVCIDLFLAGSENFGSILLIRTGPWDYSKEIVTYALGVGKQFKDGNLCHKASGVVIPTPEEIDVYNALKLRWIEPAQRMGPEAVRR